MVAALKRWILAKKDKIPLIRRSLNRWIHDFINTKDQRFRSLAVLYSAIIIQGLLSGKHLKLYPSNPVLSTNTAIATLLGGLCGAVLVILIQVYRFIIRRRESTYLILYIVVGVLSAVSFGEFFLFNSKVFLLLGIAMLSSLLWVFLWNKSHINVERERYVSILLALCAYILACWCFCQSAHILYSMSSTLLYVWTIVWDNIFPSQIQSMFDRLQTFTVLPIGITFLSGCLLIISWSKDRPCSHWNPFSASALNISSPIALTSLGALIALAYSVIAGAYRFAFISMLFLCASNVATAVFCYNLQSDDFIANKIIKYLDITNLGIIIDKDKRIHPLNPEGKLQGREVKRISDCLSNAISETRKITSTIIRHMADHDDVTQVQYMINLIQLVYSNVRKADNLRIVAFILGFSCVPNEMNKEIRVDDIEYFIKQIIAFFIDFPNKNHNGNPDLQEAKNFGRHIVYGLHVALKCYISQISRHKKLDNNLDAIKSLESGIDEYIHKRLDDVEKYECKLQQLLHHYEIATSQLEHMGDATTEQEQPMDANQSENLPIIEGLYGLLFQTVYKYSNGFIDMEKFTK